MPQGKKIISCGQTYVIGLPKGGSTADSTVQKHWDQYSELLRSASPAHAHRGHFWCREASKEVPAARIARSLSEGGSWRQYYSALRSKDVGFRPVMELPEGHGFQTGDTPRRFTLTMDGRITYFNAAQKRAPRHYHHGGKLHFVDNYSDHRLLIPWVVVGDYAIAAENLLVDISWDDLCSQGFVSEPSL